MSRREIITYGNVWPQFYRLGIKPKKTFQDGEVRVWEITAKDFKVLVSEKHPENREDDPWLKAGCGWQAPVGSNLGQVNKRYRVNGHYVQGWDTSRGDGESDGYGHRNFEGISDYLEYAVGATTERNVTACYACLAKQNGMKISELLARYGA